MQRIFRLDHVDPEYNFNEIEQSPELAALANDIKNEFERRREERRPFELQWRLNQNFLQGNQYCDVNEDTGEVVDQPAETDWEYRNVYNQIAPIVETRLSKLSRVQPGLVVRPLTADTEDIMTAKTSTRLLKATYAAKDMGERIMEATYWAEICCSAFYKSVWNPYSGRILGYSNGKPVYEGDIETVVVSPYEIFPASCYISGIDNQDSIIHARVYSVEEIELVFGIRVPGRTMNVMNMDITGMGHGGIGYNPNMVQVRDYSMEDAELVLEWYEKPSRMFPSGRHVTVVGDYVLDISELPFKVGTYFRRGYPFVQQFCLPNPTIFWGTSIIERLIPLQRDYNATKNRINEHIARMAVGNLVYEKGSVNDDLILTYGLQPGTALEYNTGTQAPQWMQVAEIPQTLFAKITEMRNEFIDISGVSEMSKTSAAPTAVSSGVGLEILKEQDDTRLTLTAENIRNAVKHVGQHWLRLFKQFVTVPRISRIVGNDVGDVITMIWKGSDVTSDDVIVDTNNEMTNTPAQRKQLALELMQAGMFNDPDTGRMTRETRAKLMEIFELGNWEATIDIDELHSVRAQRENMLLEKEDIPKIMQLDNHSLHIQEHIRYALSAEFRKMQERKPELATALLQHIEGHKTLAVDQAMRLSGQGSMVSGISPDAMMNPEALQQGVDPNQAQ